MIKCPPNCGLCCTHCDKIIELVDLDRGDGVCRHLTHDKQCSIYKDRPDVCSVRMMKEVYMPDMPDKDFVELTLVYCRKLGAKV